MSTIDDLVQGNEGYAQSFTGAEALGPPTRGVAVVACMDARLIPSRFLDLEPGEAHIIRNAGGSARDALRSLVISQRLLGTRAVAVIKHTDCGMLTFSNEDLRGRVKEELGADASQIDFLPFSSLEQAVRDDVDFLRSSPLIGDDVELRGFIYDVDTGRLGEVR
jgi:carbonic anhydrase